MEHTFRTFLESLDHAHRDYQANMPPVSKVFQWVDEMYHFLFPLKCENSSPPSLRFGHLREDLVGLLYPFYGGKMAECKEKADAFFALLPENHALLKSDIIAFEQSDPAATSQVEVIATYPGFLAICVYRIAHALYELQVPLLPRICTEYAHRQTGIDIHPAAQIGHSFFIDHGTGVVIGATCIVGNHVKIYQGVTLGALQVDKSMAEQKRHPTIEDHVVIYANATILGGKTVVGHHSVIGGNTWLTKSVEPWSVVQHESQVRIRPKHLQDTINFVI